MTPAEKKLTRARIALITNQAFFGTLAMRLQLVPMAEDMRRSMIAKGMKPTLAVDGKRVFFDEEFINSLSHELCMSALAHEVGHCIYEHIGRRGDRDPVRWNIAGDYVINAMLKDADFQLGEGWLYNPQWGVDKSAEWVYNQLPPSPPSGGQSPGTGQPGGGQGQGNGQPLCDILEDESKIDPALNDDWKIATAQAATQAQQAGKLPASMKRFVDELLNPKTDWRTQLRRFITETSKNDYSWAKPNRKMLAGHGVYLPSLHSERMGRIVVAIDTSGSITREMLNIFASEINAIRADVNPEETLVIYCDAAVNKVTRFTPEDILDLEMVGGGGTSFHPPFKWLDKHDVRPVCMLYMTDGYGDGWPTPDFPLLWCMTTDVQPGSGETIRLELDAS